MVVGTVVIGDDEFVAGKLRTLTNIFSPEIVIKPDQIWEDNVRDDERSQGVVVAMIKSSG